MTARAIWKAEICLDTLRVPVKLYAAIQDTTTHFRLLNKADLTPVRQQMVETASKAVVESDEIQRAIQVDPGEYVVIDDEEREKLEPEASREIVIRQVVDRSVVDDRWFDHPYYLGPDGDDDRYFALAEALQEGKHLAIAQWVMRGDRFAGAIHANDGYLMLSTFRHADELLPIDRIRPEAGRAPDKRELALADQLISALEDTFDPYAYQDDYQDRVREYVRKRAAGKKVRFPRAQPVVADDDSLLKSLEASVKQGKGGSRAAKKR